MCYGYYSSHAAAEGGRIIPTVGEREYAAVLAKRGGGIGPKDVDNRGRFASKIQMTLKKPLRILRE